jgi:DNA repair protein RadC
MKKKGYRIKDLHKVDRPREKLINYGPKKLSTTELLAIIIGSGYTGKNVISLAGEILKKNTIKGLKKLKYDLLKKEKGIGSAKATQLIAAIELGRRIYKQEEVIKFQEPKDVYGHLGNLRKKKKEHFVALYLNTQNELIHQETISIGSLNANIVHPREVFEPAIKHLAARIIVAHNHPSGNVEPTKPDINVIDNLVQAGKILGIMVSDHIIIGRDSYYSFKDHNKI